MDMTKVLPIDCISKIICFTTPKDASRSCLVSSIFKDSADSDVVWQSFVPSDFREIVKQSSSSCPTFFNSLSPKQLYLHLCDHPLLLPNANMSFGLDKESGKKCYIIGSKDLNITWGGVPAFWTWTSALDSRFSQVAKLNYAWCFEVKGSFGTKVLSPKTRYGVFFVFKFGTKNCGFKDRYVELSVKHKGSINNGCHKRVILDPPQQDDVQQREDGWMEVEMGDFFNENRDEYDFVEFRIWETNGLYTKEGLVIEGVEFRPKIIK